MELAEIISDNITGEDLRIISICGRFYRVKPPTPFVLGRMLKYLSRINLPESNDRMSLIAKSAEQYRYMDRVIAIAILGDRMLTPWNRLRLWLYGRRFRKASDGDRLMAFKDILSIVIPDCFFVYARLAMELTNRVARRSAD
ncbi:MAG: hypothetical protein LBG96_07510 [Tannerella sp.]|jgi:hypothetical protein|nr:hypothetical protein [Tannerella sp.]